MIINFPPIPDRLFKRLGLRNKQDQETASYIARCFFETLKRMDSVERQLIYEIFLHCCPAELPENVHINVDLLRRIANMSSARMKRILAGLVSLGFECSIREDPDEEHGIGKPQSILVLEWHLMAVLAGGNYTGFAKELIDAATDGYCEDHAREALLRLDFCQIASATTTADSHL